MILSETRKFSMHPDLLYSVIKNQAGSIGKAILELVMNSIDAGATRVDITLDRRTVKVADDGKGFTSRQEIDEFFETFGTPHPENDPHAVYGRFRMGRGQIMAFCQNTWVSGGFEMDVDIQKHGLDYTLRTGLKQVPGCLIDGIMYEPLSPSEVHSTVNQLREQCLYTPVPIFLNGEQINKDTAKEKWTVVTEDAFIRIESQSHRLSIFNLGVLVCHENAGQYGVGGVVVSRKALEVNFARNDVIKGKCPVWKKVKPILTQYADKKDTRERRTDDWRDFKAQELLSWDGSSEKGRELRAAPIFTDLTGKHWSVDGLAGYRVKQVTIGLPSSLKADRLHQAGIAIVLDEDKMRRRLGSRSFDFLLKRLSEVDMKGVHHGLPHVAGDVHKKLVPFEKLAKTITDDHYVIPKNELNSAPTTTLAVVNDLQNWLTSAMNRSGQGFNFSKRQIYAMRSETVEAYTDGNSAIYLHEKYLSGSESGPSRGIAWAASVVNLFVHEYLHDSNSGIGHTHDAEFYELFHQLMQSGAVAKVVAALFRTYASALKRIPASLARQLDQVAVVEDHHTDSLPPKGDTPVAR